MIIKSFSIEYEKLLQHYKVMLVYGSNYYLKNEITNKLSNILKKNNHKTTFIKQEDLLKNIVVLDNYLNQDSLFGEKEVLIISDVSDKILTHLKIESINKEILFISENLPKSSKLRNIAEKNKSIACIPCYEDDEKTLKNILQQGLRSLNLKIENGVIDQLFSFNKLTRSDVNSGLEKLELISREKEINSEIINTLFNTTSAFDAFQISNAVLSSNKQELNKILSSFYHFALNFNEIIGPLKYKINKLIGIYETDINEKRISVLVEKYRPPIFWKEKTIIQTQMLRWSKKELDILLEKINQIETLCKINYEISETIFNKFLLDIVTKKVLFNTYFSH